MISTEIRMISAAMLIAAAFTLMSPVPALGLTPNDVEQHERDVFAAWDANDAERLVALNATGERGLGYRSRGIREFSSETAALEGLSKWYASMDYFKLKLDEIHTDVKGDTGIAWGVFTEQFQIKGREPETVRVRFTDVWQRDEKGWHLLIYHRDSQSFDEQGRYIPENQ